MLLDDNLIISFYNKHFWIENKMYLLRVKWWENIFLMEDRKKGKLANAQWYPGWQMNSVLWNKKLPAPLARVSVTSSLSLGKLLWIVLSFCFTQHHKIVLKNNNMNKAFHKGSHVNPNKNNTNTCKWLSLAWEGFCYCSHIVPGFRDSQLYGLCLF